MVAVVHQVKYPQATNDTVALTLTAASLASSSTLWVGREATKVDNTTNLDEDHLLSGVVAAGTSPTAGGKIEVWLMVPRKIVSGTATWPQSATGSDAGLTLSSDNLKGSGWLKLVASITVDATSNAAYDFGGISVAALCGGSMPPMWSLFLVQSTGVALNATGGNHGFFYERIESQSN